MPSWGSGACTCFNWLEMPWLQLWFKMHCASWNASRCSLSFSSYLPAEILSSILRCCPNYNVSTSSAPKPIWFEGVLQEKKAFAVWTSIAAGTSLQAPIIFTFPISVLPWGSCIHSSQQHSTDWKVFQIRCADLARNHESCPQRWH